MKDLRRQRSPFMARRSMAAATYDGKIYFFGGVGARGTESILDVSNDLWCFDPKMLSWIEIVNTEATPWPSPRRCMGFASMEQGIYLWGGSGLETEESRGLTYTFLNDLWLFRPQRASWELLEASDDHKESPLNSSQAGRPEPRYTPVWHVRQNKGVLFSGYTEDRLGKRKMNDLWIWEGAPGRWRKVEGRDLSSGYDVSFRWPGLRYGTMSVSDDQALYICGGFSNEGDHNDVWHWNLGEEKWECLSPDISAKDAPPARYYGACALHNDGIWIFGGRSRRYPKLNFSDTWRFDISARRWELIEPQCDMHIYDETATNIGYHAKAASAVVEDQWYVWGGEGLHGHVSDFWHFDFAQRCWQMIQPARDDDPIFW